MHHQAGVKTVAAGSLPSCGPMQTPSGSRGAQAYTLDYLDTNIAIAKESNASASNFLTERQEDVSFHTPVSIFETRSERARALHSNLFTKLPIAGYSTPRIQFKISGTCGGTRKMPFGPSQSCVFKGRRALPPW